MRSLGKVTGVASVIEQ